MATTVNQAFAEFMKDKVRLDPDRNSVAKASKDWLVKEVVKFANDGLFPKFYDDNQFIEYGSYSRKTKIRELDDIDIIFALHGQACTYDEFFDKIVINVNPNATQLLDLRHQDSTYLNSRKVINKFISYLGNIPNYEKADIKRNLEAATLNLKSYEWVYDIVPAFITSPNNQGRSYYLIPDGNGHWKKTDPRIDKQRITDISGLHAISIRDVIRIVKYWNRRQTMATLSSYALEVLLLEYYQHNSSQTHIDIELPKIFAYVQKRIFGTIDDPKGIQGDLNHLSYGERMSIYNKAGEDYNKATEASTFENNQQMKEAIAKWGEIFGGDFPRYN